MLKELKPAQRRIAEEDSTQWERLGLCHKVELSWKYKGGDWESSVMSPVGGDRWRCSVVKQLEVNLCRVEIAELWAALNSHRRKSGKLKEVRWNACTHVHMCLASDWKSKATLF